MVTSRGGVLVDRNGDFRMPQKALVDVGGRDGLLGLLHGESGQMDVADQGKVHVARRVDPADRREVAFLKDLHPQLVGDGEGVDETGLFRRRLRVLGAQGRRERGRAEQDG